MVESNIKRVAKKPCPEEKTLFLYIGSLIAEFEIEEPLHGQQCITWYSNIGSTSLRELSGGAYKKIHQEVQLLQKNSILSVSKERKNSHAFDV